MAAVTALGLGKIMEKKLHSVGIHSAEELTEIGSKLFSGSKRNVQTLCCHSLSFGSGYPWC